MPGLDVGLPEARRQCTRAVDETVWSEPLAEAGRGPGRGDRGTLLGEVLDPEIPISLPELGLIYGVDFRGRVSRTVSTLTFTATACPCMEFIREDVTDRLEREHWIDEGRARGGLGSTVDERKDHPEGTGEAAPMLGVSAAEVRPARAPRNEIARLMKEIVYDVFARKDRGDPLVHIGYVDALDDETATGLRAGRRTTRRSGSRCTWWPVGEHPAGEPLRGTVRPGFREARSMSDLSGDPAESLDEETQTALQRLILTLADSKRLMGIRYSDWLLGAPSIETGIAASSMAQDEWGHARLLYAMLKALRHRSGGGRARPPEPEEYASVAALDEPMPDWAALVAAMVVADGALTAVLASFAEGRLRCSRRRPVPKMLAEEEFHASLGAAWFKRLARLDGEAKPATLLTRGRVDRCCRRCWPGSAPTTTPMSALVDAGLRGPGRGPPRALRAGRGGDAYWRRPGSTSMDVRGRRRLGRGAWPYPRVSRPRKPSSGRAATATACSSSVSA